MFDAIAGQYDLMNRVMTMGQDQRWRRFVVSRLGHLQKGRVLDLATGTGDIAALLAEEFPELYVTGGDFSQNMLHFAKGRFAEANIDWQACDANHLPFADNFFDGVTFGYLLRNVDDVPTVLTEIHRVLKSGGTIVSLDTTPPAKNILYPFITAYLRYGIPILGRMIASDEAAYSYLTGSTMGFYKADDLAKAFTDAGFKRVEYKKFMCGTIAVHWGKK
jgi:demethylmenaquinone methyltransferase/2-methoxy-6-polyprenyl-1,4-benzoquinol methylase